MKYLVADDEYFVLKGIVRNLNEVLPKNSQIITALTSKDALASAKDHKPYVAFLDIDMPVMNGIELAKKITEASPETNIVFITAYSEYSLDAWDTEASAFLQKPVTAERIRNALSKLRKPASEKKIYVHCFGNFEIYFGEKRIRFERGLTMEFFAFLVHKWGAEVYMDQVRCALWTEAEDSESKRSYIRNLVYDVRNTFKGIGIDDILLNNNKGAYFLDTQRIISDYREWLEGRAAKPMGQYMELYSWAEETRAEIEASIENNKKR